MKHKLCAILSAVLLCALCMAPAHALEYTFSGADDYLFGRPTSDDAVYQWENPNVDRSKNTALIPPGFGTPTSYLPGSGVYLTPNLVPGALSGGLVNQMGSVGSPNGGASTSAANSGYPASGSSVTVDSGGYPTVDADAFWTGGSYPGYTEATPDLYYSDGSLGVLKIPSLGVNVKVYQGTDGDTLYKGAGHFESTSIWNGNVAVAAHNRGVNFYFAKIHTLSPGDTVILTTKLGTRTYAVTSVTKISVNDISGLETSSANMITLYTCVSDHPEYRWCVRGVELAA